jgi:hypothetical protein
MHSIIFFTLVAGAFAAPISNSTLPAYPRKLVVRHAMIECSNPTYIAGNQLVDNEFGQSTLSKRNKPTHEFTRRAASNPVGIVTGLVQTVLQLLTGLLGGVVPGLPDVGSLVPALPDVGSIVPSVPFAGSIVPGVGSGLPLVG